MKNHTNYGVISTETVKAINEKIANGEVEMGIDLGSDQDTSIIDGEVQEKKDAPEDKEETNDNEFGVIISDCNFRSTPDRKSPKNVLGQLIAGAEVSILDETHLTNEWAHICTEQGVEGYVLSKLMDFKTKEE